MDKPGAKVEFGPNVMVFAEDEDLLCWAREMGCEQVAYVRTWKTRVIN